MSRALILAALLIALDQATKLLVQQSFALGEVMPVMPHFNLVHVLNPGAAFSFLADAGGWQRYFFLTLAVGVSVWLLSGLRRPPSQRLIGWLPASLITAGALGNAIDRLVHGAVIDFLDFYWGSAHWPAFNVADICIVVGVVLMLVAELLFRPQAEPST